MNIKDGSINQDKIDPKIVLKLDQLEIQNKDLQTKMTNNIRDINNKVSNLEHKITSKDSEIREVQRKIKTQETITTDNNDKIFKLDKQLKDMYRSNELKNKDIVMYANKIKFLGDKLFDLENTQEARNKDATVKYDEFIKRAESTIIDMDRRNVNTNKDFLSRIDVLSSEYIANLASLESKINKLDSVLANQNKDIINMKNELSQLTMTVQHLELLHETKINKLEQDFTDKIDQLVKTLELTNQKLCELENTPKRIIIEDFL